jgi:hypothetical protein
MTMQLRHLSAVLVAAVASGAAAQTTTPAPAKPSSRTLTLSGCVQRGDTAADPYMFVDRKNKATYRLSGADVRDYVGRPVQVVGGVVGSKRLQISGGLRPTPNVAAQAGDMDPSRAATAAASAGPGTGPPPRLEFRIKSVRPLEGACPD